MKNLIYILVISLTVGCITGAGTIRNQTNSSSIEHSISEFQNNTSKLIITNYSGVAIRYNDLINSLIHKDLQGFNFRTLMPEVNSPGDHIQIHTKEVINMVARISNTELRRRRVLYYAAKRRVDSLEDKRKASMNIIKTGKKERIQVDKETNEKIVVTVKLTDAQIVDEKRILADLDLELEKAQDNLKLRDFGFSKAVKNQTDDILSRRQAYKERKEEEKLNTVKTLMNSAVRNGSMQQVIDLQKLSGDGGKIKAVKAEMMKIIRKENKNGYPIRNLSLKTVEIIMNGLLNWNTENSDQPFDVS